MEIALCRFTSGTPREALDALDAGGWDLLSKAHGKNPDESPENCHGKIWKNPIFHGFEWKKIMALDIHIIHWIPLGRPSIFFHDENNWDNHSEGFSVSFGVHKMLKNQGMMVVHGCTVHGNLIE